MNIAFLNQNALIQRETVGALRRLPGVKVIALDVTTHPAPQQVEQMCRILLEHRCSMVFTTNEWGFDDSGIFWNFCNNHSILQVNWFVDDPFYEELILNKKFRQSLMRIDFVSDKGYLEIMRTKGYHVHFLPLATDPSIFFPSSEPQQRYLHDIVFVGNSYSKQMDALLQLAPGFIDVLSPFLPKIVSNYCADMTFEIEAALSEKLRSTPLPPSLSFEKALFIAKHAAGFFGRKKMIAALVNKYPGFMVYGEPGWLLELPKEKLGTAKYYNTLCQVYRSSKIILDINRMVIRNGCTQRAFDAPASGSFLLTSAKPVIGELFSTEGIGQEIAVFDNLSSLVDNIRYYLSHDTERLAIAERGNKKVLAAHTYDHRIAEMFTIIATSANSKPSFI